MKIILSPNLILRQVSEQVVKFDDELNNFVGQLSEFLKLQTAYAIAAPQVGFLKRIIITQQNYFINPKITYQSSNITPLIEGCLSIPGKGILVNRPNEIVVEYQNLLGEIKQSKFSGLDSKIIQHEIDHLDGILMIDRTKK